MTGPNDTIRVVIPLTIRKRNGRPKILPPDEVTLRDGRTQDAHVLRAIARAWNWRRRLERGEASTIADIANAENLSDRYVSRMVRLAYLAPAVLEKLVLERSPSPMSIKDLAVAAELAWVEQESVVFG